MANVSVEHAEPLIIITLTKSEWESIQYTFWWGGSHPDDPENFFEDPLVAWNIWNQVQSTLYGHEIVS